MFHSALRSAANYRTCKPRVKVTLDLEMQQSTFMNNKTISRVFYFHWGLFGLRTSTGTRCGPTLERKLEWIHGDQLILGLFATEPQLLDAICTHTDSPARINYFFRSRFCPLPWNMVIIFLSEVYPVMWPVSWTTDKSKNKDVQNPAVKPDVWFRKSLNQFLWNFAEYFSFPNHKIGVSGWSLFLIHKFSLWENAHFKINIFGLGWVWPALFICLFCYADMESIAKVRIETHSCPVMSKPLHQVPS